MDVEKLRGLKASRDRAWEEFERLQKAMDIAVVTLAKDRILPLVALLSQSVAQLEDMCRSEHPISRNEIYDGTNRLINVSSRIRDELEVGRYVGPAGASTQIDCVQETKGFSVSQEGDPEEEDYLGKWSSVKSIAESTYPSLAKRLRDAPVLLNGERKTVSLGDMRLPGSERKWLQRAVHSEMGPGWGLV